MGLIRSALKVFIIAYIAKYLYSYLASRGVGIHFNNVHPGKCRIVPGITCGSEQISVTSDGLAFITNGFKELTRCNPLYTKGHLFTFDFNHPDDNVKELKIISQTINPDSFDPHGMDILEYADEGFVHVYVVNHENNTESIEVFVYNQDVPDKIVHIDTILDEKFLCLNDITVVDKEHFYVTNWLKYCKLGQMLSTVELLGQFKTASIVYYNHGETQIVAVGSIYNGITLSKDKSKILTARSANMGVDVFDRGADGLLTLRTNVFLGHVPDNIFLDKQSGHYYAAYFKHPFNTPLLAANKTKFSSSGGAVIKFDETMDTSDVKEVFFDSGEDFVHAASAFVHYKGQYLIGTIFDKLGYCKK